VAVELASIRISDLLRGGIWEFDTYHESTHDGTRVFRIANLPASTLDNRVAAINVKLADGTLVPATIGNLDVKNPRGTRIFLSLSLYLLNEWFHLARHFDVEYDRYGPTALARALGKPLDLVFPISYDLSHVLIGDAACVVGQVPAIPQERITRSEAIRLAVGGTAL
jgi:hypothetical protein